MLTIVIDRCTHAEHVNIVGQDAFAREVHGLRLGVTMLNVGLGILEIPRPNDDQITFTDPLPATHFPRNPSHSTLSVLAQNGDPPTAEDLRSQRKHFVDFLVGHFDTDFSVACVFRILKTCEFLDVHFFLKSATQSVSPNIASGQPFLKSPPKTVPSAGSAAHQAPTRALAADSARAMS